MSVMCKRRSAPSFPTRNPRESARQRQALLWDRRTRARIAQAPRVVERPMPSWPATVFVVALSVLFVVLFAAVFLSGNGLTRGSI